MKIWTKPEAIEIKMDAEISSYQDDNYDPMKDGPLFVRADGEVPTELDTQRPTPRA